MTLEDLGYNSALEEYRKEHTLDSFEIGRVLLEHKERYVVKTATQEFDAELMGNLRFSAETRRDLPAVGDWVAFLEYDEGKALIHAVLPRKSIIERKAVGKLGQTQIIATNIDFGLIVQSIDRDFNINRLERYLTICNASKIEPMIILNKIDLLEQRQVEELLLLVKERIKNAISCESQAGIDALRSKLIKGYTYCLLGSSGVGKSTLINTLAGNNLMETGEISKIIGRGKHVTSHRELIVLDNGILIDNPGMREVGITNISDGLERTFNEILNLSKDCKYSDCTHINENGCAVLDAIENEELDTDLYKNYLKMEKERIHFESDTKERKRKDKDLGKMIRNIQKQKRNSKY
jgi:ribosome biogenesis GTPase